MTYTKHYYIGSERISAKTGTAAMGFYPKNDVLGQFPTFDDAAIKAAADEALTDAETIITGIYAKFLPTAPVFNRNGEDGTSGYNHSGGEEDLNIYYFHPDHLGSSAYISNAAGVVTQHMEYLPFGEALVDEHTNSFNSPFKYNGKEFDEETGNYYYGARYYDPKWSIFISVDPLAEQTMDAYGYCYQNPVRSVDLDGRVPGDPVVGYHNTSADAGKSILSNGFKSGKSGWNYFMTNPNGTKAGSAVASQPLQFRSSINMDNAKTISYKQWRGFFDQAKASLGLEAIENNKLSTDQIKTLNAIRNNTAVEYMNKVGGDAFVIEAEAGASGQRFLALTDAAIESRIGSTSLVKGADLFNMPKSGGMFKFGSMALRFIGETILIEGAIYGIRKQGESEMNYVQRRSLNGKSPFMNWLTDTYSDVGLYYWYKYSNTNDKTNKNK